MTTHENAEDDVRQRAILRLKKKREFQMHLLAYVMVNSMLIAVWALTGAGFFWPIFPLCGWAIGVAFHALDVFWSDQFSEERIRREIDRM